MRGHLSASMLCIRANSARLHMEKVLHICTSTLSSRLACMQAHTLVKDKIHACVCMSLSVSASGLFTPAVVLTTVWIIVSVMRRDPLETID